MPNLRPNSAYSSQPGVALVHTLNGDPVEESGRPNSTNEGVSQAVDSIYRDYEPPKRTAPEPNRFGQTKVLCATDGCKAFPTKTGHCVGHSRSLGLIENWNQEGRKPHEPD
jgi:hypothetical protein